MSDRGIKKWAPFKSLKEQADALRKEFEKKRAEEKPYLSEAKMEEIGAVLNLLNRGQTVAITYYEDGHIVEETLTYLGCDTYNRRLRLDGKTLSYDDILDVSPVSAEWDDLADRLDQ